ncbi:MAG TPA: response regulator [Pyrinomonadaceae bacterium]
MNTSERLRVLYVEDNSDSFEMLRVMLGLSQIDLERAASLGEALRRAGSDRFDLYLLDSELPDGSGTSLCRTLRTVDPSVPVLFYSGVAQAEEIKLAVAAGADGYITKPYSDELAPTITQLVANRRENSLMPESLSPFAVAA